MNLPVTLAGRFFRLIYTLVAVAACIVMCFMIAFSFHISNTLTTPVMMNMYAWNKSTATLYRSMSTAASSLLSILVYIIIKKIAAIGVSERAINLGGFLSLLLSFISFIPITGPHPDISLAPVSYPTQALAAVPLLQQDTFNIFSLQHSLEPWKGISDSPSAKSTSHETTPRPDKTAFDNMNRSSSSTTPPTTTTNSTYPPEGCPWSYDWCFTVPRINIIQFILGRLLFAIGYPTAHVMTVTIFTKVLPPGHQGTWMGIYQSSACVAGMLGPVPVATLYDTLGPRVTFTACSGLTAASVLFYLTVYRRFVPFGTLR